MYTARLIFFLSYIVPHQIHKNTQVIVAAVLLVFKLHFSHFNLSAFSAWSRCLCGHETLYVILAHVAGVLGQTPDERLRKQFPWMCLLSRPSPLSHALSASFWGWITFLASLQCVIYIGTRSRAHACTHAHTRRLLWHSHAAWQIPPSAKKSINKCIVSSLSAVGISLSKLSEKAAECEIEFRTVRRVRWHKMSVCLLIYSYCSGVQTWFCKKGSVKHTEVLSVEIWQV